MVSCFSISDRKEGEQNRISPSTICGTFPGIVDHITYVVLELNLRSLHGKPCILLGELCSSLVSPAVDLNVIMTTLIILHYYVKLIFP